MIVDPPCYTAFSGLGFVFVVGFFFLLFWVCGFFLLLFCFLLDSTSTVCFIIILVLAKSVCYLLIRTSGAENVPERN